MQQHLTVCWDSCDTLQLEVLQQTQSGGVEAKVLLLLGYIIHKHRHLVAPAPAPQPVVEVSKNTVECEALSVLQGKMANMQCRHDTEMRAEKNLHSRLQQQVTALSAQHQQAERLIVESWQFKLGVLEEQLRLSREQAQGTMLDTLRQELRHKAEELENLRATNSGKRLVGEKLVAELLCTAFDTGEVLSVAGMPHQCDLRLQLAPHEILVFEVKFVRTGIATAETEKFVSDMAGMDPATVLGGVFVSLQSPNIAGRGTCSIECLANGIHVLWLGFSTTAQATDLLIPLVRMMLAFCRAHRAAHGESTRPAWSESSLREVRDKMQRQIHGTNQLLRGMRNLAKSQTQMLRDMNALLVRNVRRMAVDKS